MFCSKHVLSPSNFNRISGPSLDAIYTFDAKEMARLSALEMAMASDGERWLGEGQIFWL
jgi:hypothetical protein